MRLHGSSQGIFDHHASAYDRWAGRLAGGLYARAVGDAVAAAPAGGTVVDAGTGPGRVAVGIADARPDLTVHAVDISADMIRLAGERARAAGVAERVHAVRADVADLPLPDASVDLVVSTASLHHWADVPAAVRELRRVLRPDGRVWIYDFRLAPWRRLSEALGTPAPRTGAGLLFARATFPRLP